MWLSYFIKVVLDKPLGPSMLPGLTLPHSTWLISAWAHSKDPVDNVMWCSLVLVWTPSDLTPKIIAKL